MRTITHTMTGRRKAGAIEWDNKSMFTHDSIVVPRVIKSTIYFREVYVYRLIAKGTIEENMLRLADMKRYDTIFYSTSVK